MRLAAGLSQEQLAEAAGLSTRAVSDLERGVHPTARTATVDALGNALGAGALAQLRVANHGPQATSGLPPALTARPDEAPFVGRDDDLHHLERGWEDARSGRTVVADVSGDPGVGKSRLVRVFAAGVAMGGDAVLAGQCEDGPADPYRPFVEALSTAGVRGGAPGVGVIFGDSAGPTRWDRFEVVRSWFVQLSSRGPVLLVLEDLHWAQPSDLLLLRHLARPPGCGPVLIVATHRPGFADCERSLRELRRDAAVREVVLYGLEPPAIAELAEHAVGTAGRGWGRELGRRTDGNPWAIVEVLHAVASREGALDERFDAVLRSDQLASVAGHVVDERVARLDARTVELVELGSVFGREIQLEALARAAGSSEAEVVELALSAVAAGVWRERSQGAGWTFTHDLVHDVVYGSLGPNRKAVLHRAVADATQGSAPPAEVARHRLAGLPAGGRSEAVAAARLAAERAASGRAWDEAAQFWASAAAALEGDPSRAEDRLESLLAAGDARLRALARQDARPLFREAASLAASQGDRDALRRAARGYAHMTKAGAPDPLAQALWTSALGDQPGGEPDAVLLAALAIDRNLAGDHRGADDASAQALDAGRASADADVASMVVATRSLCLWGTAHPAVRRQLAEDLVEVGQGAERNDIVLDGLELAGVPLLELGDLDGFLRTRDRLEELGEREGRRVSVAQAHQWSALVHLLRSEHDLAQHAADCAGQIAMDAPNFGAGHAAQTYAIYRSSGRGAELADALRTTIGCQPGPTPWQAMYALTEAQAGRIDTARRALAVLAADDFGWLRHDWSRVATLALAAEAAALLEERRVAEVLRDQLAPFAGTLVVVASGTSCEGSVDRYLAICARLAGDEPEARRRSRAAIALEEQVGASGLAARSRALLSDD